MTKWGEKMERKAFVKAILVSSEPGGYGSACLCETRSGPCDSC